VSLARRVAEIEPFLAVEVAERGQAMERQGIDVVHLEYGEPDFAPPTVVQEALRHWLRQQAHATLVREYEEGYRRRPETKREIDAAMAITTGRRTASRSRPSRSSSRPAPRRPCSCCSARSSTPATRSC